jgi:nickel-dependent lactate racemase
MHISLPYGRSSIAGEVPDSVAVEFANPREWLEKQSERELVIAAMSHPSGQRRLRELASGARSAVIVTCDKTRGVPSQITMPLILEELISAGLPSDCVSILVATGLHKGETEADVRERIGSELQGMEVSVHDSDEHDPLSFLGNLSSGTPLYLNSGVLEADLVILESTVEPHFFAGFTGGSKVILPGVAGSETIIHNHSWQNIDDSRSRYGVADNPIRRDSNEALGFLKKTFALNLVLGYDKRIVFASSGDPIHSFDKAAEEVSAHSEIKIIGQPNLVITTNGGFPLDRNVYQCVKGISVPEDVLRQDSRIVMIGECIDGTAHDEFRNLLCNGTPDEVYSKLKMSGVPVRDQWQVQVLCRILRRNPVWFVTRSELQSDIESMHMHYASTIQEALNSAQLATGERVLVVPQGPSTILHRV